MNRYPPGQSVRSKSTWDVEGVLTDPPSPSPTCEIYFPDGTKFETTPIRDSAGQWHADFVVPFTMKPGIGVQRWQSVSVAIPANALKEHHFEVVPLGYR